MLLGKVSNLAIQADANKQQQIRTAPNACDATSMGAAAVHAENETVPEV